MQPSLFEETGFTPQVTPSAFKLRDYQEQAVNKILWAMKPVKKKKLVAEVEI